MTGDLVSSFPRIGVSGFEMFWMSFLTTKDVAAEISHTVVVASQINGFRRENKGGKFPSRVIQSVRSVNRSG